MVKLLMLKRSPFSLTLRTKLVLCTAVILVVACLLLGWLTSVPTLIEEIQLVSEHLDAVVGVYVGK